MRFKPLLPALMAFALTTPAESAQDCRAALLKSQVGLLRESNAIWTSCRSEELKSGAALFSGCDTPFGPDELDQAYVKAEKILFAGCPWDDGSTEYNESTSIHELGWLEPYCMGPDRGDAGCDYRFNYFGESVAPSGYVSSCLGCQSDNMNWYTTQLLFRHFARGAAVEAPTLQCQLALATATSRYLQKRSLALEKCWARALKLESSGSCPGPANGKVAQTLAKLRAKFARKVCGACGGDDHQCDESVAGQAGSGSNDDLPIASIGAAGSCMTLESPSSGACYRRIDSISDLASCAACVAESLGDCQVELATRWGQKLSPACGGDGWDLVVFNEDFDGPPADAWPEPWRISGDAPAIANVDRDSGRLRPQPLPGSHAHVVATQIATDVDIRVGIETEDTDESAIRVVLHDDGAGNGYRIEVQGEFPDTVLKLQRVAGGIATDLDSYTDGSELQLWSGYRAFGRFRTTQEGSATRIQASIWSPSNNEPMEWQVDALDATPLLQTTSGIGFGAVNLKSAAGEAADVRLREIAVRRTRNPIDTLGPGVVAATGFLSAGGPLWRSSTSTLLIADRAANIVYEYDPVSNAVTAVVTPSGHAGGVALDLDGNLVSTQYDARAVVRIEGEGAPATVIGEYEGQPFNAPHDVAIDKSGRVYFSDPGYGVASEDRTQHWNALYRLELDGSVTDIESWSAYESQVPGGVAILPGQRAIWTTETSLGQLRRTHLEESGWTTFERLVEGLDAPTGLCVHPEDGTVFVATANGMEVRDAGGARWGSIAMPTTPTDCTVGGLQGARTLFVTTATSLRRFACE